MDDIQEVLTGQGDDYTTSCLLDYNDFDQSNVFHYWRSERNYFRFFARNCESIVTLYLWHNIKTKWQNCLIGNLTDEESWIKNNIEVTSKLSLMLLVILKMGLIFHINIIN